MIHMASTYRWWNEFTNEYSWGAYCRCGWDARGFSGQAEARRVGDRHLKEANAS